MALRAAAAALAACWLLGGPASAETVTGPSGRPVPRFESLSASVANGRRGPSTDHPIEWVYRQRGLPMRIEAESGDWRRVRDPDGALVWMRADLLGGGPTAYVLGAADDAPAPLLARPGAMRRPVAYLQRGFVATIEACQDGWLKLKAGEVRGWMRASQVWGPDC